MEHRANPDQFSLYITSNRYNLNPVQLSVLTKDWAGLDRPEVDQGISAIRMAASAEESSENGMICRNSCTNMGRQAFWDTTAA